MMSATTTWKSDMAFDAEFDGHHVGMDASAELGGKDSGFRPKSLLLAALSGCTGIDVVSLLKKMRVEYRAFRIRAEAETSDEIPKVFKSLHLVYEFEGADLPLDKLQRAVSLSQERYCSVSLMLRKAVPITYEIRTAE